MPRPPKNDNAEQNVRPENKTQTTPKGMQLGHHGRSEILSDYMRVVRDKKP
jgi:hypothetical protein